MIHFDNCLDLTPNSSRGPQTRNSTITLTTKYFFPCCELPSHHSFYIFCRASSLAAVSGPNSGLGSCPGKFAEHIGDLNVVPLWYPSCPSLTSLTLAAFSVLLGPPRPSPRTVTTDTNYQTIVSVCVHTCVCCGCPSPSGGEAGCVRATSPKR